MSQGVGSSDFLDKWEMYSIEFNDVATEDCGHCKYKHELNKIVNACSHKYGFFFKNKENVNDVILCKYACYSNELKISDECIKNYNKIYFYNKKTDSLFKNFQQNYMINHTEKINEYVRNWNNHEYIINNFFLKLLVKLEVITSRECNEYDSYSKKCKKYKKLKDIDCKYKNISYINILHAKIKKEFNDRNNECRELIRQRANEAINNNNLGFTQVTENFWLRNNLVSRENHPLPRSFYINTCDPEINQKVFISSASDPDCHQIP